MVVLFLLLFNLWPQYLVKSQKHLDQGLCANMTCIFYLKVFIQQAKLISD